MLPLGAFLIEHILVNSTVLAGPDAFRGASGAIGRVPGLLWLEILGIGLPLAAHMVIGTFIAAEIAEEGNPDARGWNVWSQRLTGIYLMNYVVFHVWGIRLSPDVLRGGADLPALMHREVAQPGWFIFHALGVLSAAWHLGNGVPRFVTRWWPGVSTRAHRASATLGMALAVVLAVAGIAALAAFARAPIPAASGGPS
jgi:succinate dehydrogenase / fumarate reductase cytochrome b subunit